MIHTSQETWCFIKQKLTVTNMIMIVTKNKVKLII